MAIVTYVQPKATSRKRGPKQRTEREIDPTVGAKVDAFFARMVRPPEDD